MTTSLGRTLVRGWTIAVVSVLAMLGFSSTVWAAGPLVRTYTVDASLARDGRLDVTATLKIDGASDGVVQRFATTRDAIGDRRYEFTITDATLTVDGKPVDGAVTNQPGAVEIRVPAGASEAVLKYSVHGAALKTSDETTTLSWPLLQGMNLPVEKFEATVRPPGAFTGIDCKAGRPTDLGICQMFSGGTHIEPHPTFTDGPRRAGDQVLVELRFSPDVVTPDERVRYLWSLDRAFSVTPLTLGVALAAAVLGGLALMWLHRTRGRDAAGVSPKLVGEFRPVAAGASEFVMVDAVRPGQVGTLVDERVDPVDVTATLLDLAVRGHLLIEELPRPSAYKPRDWRFTRRENTEALEPWERTVLDAVTAGEGTLASLLPTTLQPVLGDIQSGLYDDVVRLGWFAHRPDRTRSSWTLAGRIALAIALGVGVLLVAFTTFGLLALVLAGLAIGLGLLASAMPARTPQGSAVLGGLGVLRGQLFTQPTDQLPEGREVEELAKILPFAVVLGGADRWLDALAATDGDETPDGEDLAWYHAPADWHLRDLPDSLRTFVTTIEGELFKR